MKQFAPAIVLVALHAAAVAQPFAPAQAPAMADLRSVLRQGAPAGKAVPQRQLSPEERAELRRLLSREAQGGKKS